MKTESNLLYIKVKEKLINDIKQMQPHDRLPSRTGLVKKYQVARTTIDRAISELIGEGYLYSRDGSGTYVAEAANHLPNQKTPNQNSSWGVIVRDVREMFYAEIVRGVENFAQSNGINIILCNSDSDFAKQEQYMRRLIDFGVSGLIIVPVVSGDPRENYRLYNELIELKIPFVFCGRNAEGINAPLVASNDFYGGYIATKHLLEKGYRHIAFISRIKFRTSVDRCHGYIAALMENGIEINRKIIKLEDKSQMQPFGYEIMKNILTSDQLVDAVICINDKVAQGVYRAINEAGLSVSDDIGVIGYDNTGICEKTTPAITSAFLKNLEIGAKAAEMLFKQINGEVITDFEFYLFQPELVTRDSCLGPKNRREK
jgi:DNA-binding LacI/PurR family transcriptional regulator